jgi:plasmid stabilization system protein ParE
MVSQNDLLSRLIALVRGFDDSSWEALASKGLLRRARKELEGGLAVSVATRAESAVTLSAPPFEVSMPAAGPARATCTCPAGGVCQHILAAGLYLQSLGAAPENAPPALSPESIRDEIAPFTRERLRAWAGAAEYRAALAVVERNSLPPAFEWTDSVLVRLMPSTIEARFVPGGGLDGMIVPASKGARVAVAAMLALRAALGFEMPQVERQQSLIELTGAPRTNAEILRSAQEVMEEAVAVGLSHLSSGIGARLTTLAISAQGANLPRISLALKALADEVRALQEREAQADESRLFLSLARCWALADATRRSGDATDPGLVGISRSQYVDVPEIELCGVGAYPWQTRSGYRGLTLLFWSNKTREFLSWSEARPRAQQFDPRQRFFADGPWDGAQSPRQAASSNIVLRGARRTAAGRISGSSKTTVLVPAPTSLAHLEFGDRRFTSWPALYARAMAIQPIGLRDSNPLDRVAVLEPAFAGAKSFESVTQTLFWKVYDEEENLLQLSLSFEELSKETVRTLEALNPPANSGWKIVVNLSLGDKGLLAMPISILDPGNAGSPVFHLAFDAQPGQMSKNHARAAEEPQEEDAGSATDETADSEEPQAASAYLRGFLAEFERRLVAAAEAGTATGIAENARRFSEMRMATHSAGLTTLASALSRLTEPNTDSARCLIQARYLAHLHASAGARLA